jgi:hypothetical protein
VGIDSARVNAEEVAKEATREERRIEELGGGGEVKRSKDSDNWKGKERQTAKELYQWGVHMPFCCRASN